MTRFFIDERDVTASVPPGLNLGQVIEHLDGVMTEQETWVQDIRLDGESLDMTDLEPAEVTAEQLAGAKMVQFVTISPRVIAVEALTNFEQFLGAIGRPLDTLVGQLRQDPTPGAFAALKDLLESLRHLIDLLDLVQKVAPAIEKTHTNSDQAQRLIDELSDILGEIVHCQEASDSGGLADLIEFELHPLTGKFAELCDRLRQALDDPSADQV